MINQISGAIFEIMAFVVAAVSYPIDATKCDPKPTQSDKTPILLVHGYLHNSSAWLYMRRQLKVADLGPIYTINLGSPFHSIEDYSQMIQKKICFIEKETGNRRINLIGHSMGGLVCSYYATHIAQEGKVESIVTLGTPLHGTKIAPMGFGKCAREMRYRSKFILELQERLRYSNIRQLHLASRSDLLIRPTNSALFNHACSETYVFSNLGHLSYLYSKDVARRIICFYKTLDAGS